MFGVNSKRLDSTTSRQYVGADGEKGSYRLGFAGTLTVKYQSRFKFWIVSVGTTAAGSLSGITLRSPCLTAPTMSPRGTHDACQRDASAAGARAVVAAHRVGLAELGQHAMAAEGVGRDHGLPPNVAWHVAVR